MASYKIRFFILILFSFFSTSAGARNNTNCTRIAGQLPDSLPRLKKIMDGVMDSRWNPKTGAIEVLTLSEDRDSLHISSIRTDFKTVEPLGIMNLKDQKLDEYGFGNSHFFSEDRMAAITVVRYSGDRAFLQNYDFNGNALSDLRQLEGAKYRLARLKYYLNESLISSFMAFSSWAASAAFAEQVGLLPDHYLSHLTAASLAILGIGSGIGALYQSIRGDFNSSLPQVPPPLSIFEQANAPDRQLTESDLSRFPDISKDHLLKDPKGRYILISNQNMIQFYDLRNSGKTHTWKSKGEMRPFISDTSGETVFFTNAAGTAWYYLSLKDLLEF